MAFQWPTNADGVTHVIRSYSTHSPLFGQLKSGEVFSTSLTALFFSTFWVIVSWNYASELLKTGIVTVIRCLH